MTHRRGGTRPRPRLGLVSVLEHALLCHWGRRHSNETDAPASNGQTRASHQTVDDYNDSIELLTLLLTCQQRRATKA